MWFLFRLLNSLLLLLLSRLLLLLLSSLLLLLSSLLLLLSSLLLLLSGLLLWLSRILLLVSQPRERAQRERGRIRHHHPPRCSHHRSKHALAHGPYGSKPGIHGNTHGQKRKHHLILMLRGSSRVNLLDTSGAWVHLMSPGGSGCVHLLEMMEEVELLLHKRMDGRSDPWPAEPWRRVPIFLCRRGLLFHVIKHASLKVRQTDGGGRRWRLLGAGASGCRGKGSQVEAAAPRLPAILCFWRQLTFGALALLRGMGHLWQ